MNRPPSDVVRVVTVDDQPEVRSALRLMLGGEPDIAVVGEAVDGDHARDVIEACRPDVVLMDLRMPRCDGLVATARETALRPETAIIVLTTFDTDHHVVRALRAGACGFLLKDAPPEELAHAVRAAAQGRPVLAPAVLRRVMTLAAENTRPPDSAAVDALATLSPREREIAHALARGMSNAEIGAALFISLATVKTHVSRVIAKLGVETRTQVAALVLRNDPIRD